MLIEPRTASPEGIEFIKHCEGLKLASYEDNGIAMGYGTHRPWFKMGMTCTEDEASGWLTEDIKSGGFVLNQRLKGSIGQGAFDALQSWLYEFGEGHFEGSTLLEKFNRGDQAGAWAELPKWIHVLDPVTQKFVESDGLKKRRWTEQAMWLGQSWQDYQARDYPELVYVSDEVPTPQEEG